MGELAIVRAREKAEKTLGANGADGISNIEGKVARVATSKLGNERVSNSTFALSTMPCSSSARYRCPLSPRGSTALSRRRQRPLPGYGVSRSRVVREHRPLACRALAARQTLFTRSKCVHRKPLTMHESRGCGCAGAPRLFSLRRRGSVHRAAD